jgi:hypothetical protein
VAIDLNLANISFYHLSSNHLTEGDKNHLRMHEIADLITEEPGLAWISYPYSLSIGRGADSEHLLWLYTNQSSEADTMRIIVRTRLAKPLQALLLYLYRMSNDKSVVGIRFLPGGTFLPDTGLPEGSSILLRTLTTSELESFLPTKES